MAGRVADGAIMQGALSDPLVRFLRETVHDAARQAGRDPARVALVARLNVCVADDRTAARNVMRPTVVRSLSAQRPDFFTFATAGLTLPAGLREKVLALPYTHDPAPLRAVAGHRVACWAAMPGSTCCWCVLRTGRTVRPNAWWKRNASILDPSAC